LRREAWRAVADANAVVYRRLADDSTVFYDDIGDRFFRPDGSHNDEMWLMTSLPPNAGIHEPGFRAWAGAEALARSIRTLEDGSMRRRVCP
jgi:hypothetical protein